MKAALVSALALLALASLAAAATQKPVLATMTWSKDKGFKIIEGTLQKSPDAVAWANFTNAINATGWSYLEINTDENFPDKVQACAAGFLEGSVTSEVLYMYWQNTVDGYCQGKEAICKHTINYLKKNFKYVSKKVKQNRRSNPYWHQVGLFYDQFDCLAEGYKSKAKETGLPQVSKRDLFWMNVFGDLEDLEQVFAMRYNLPSTKVLGSGSCSALIKVLPGNADLYASHDTWNTYQSMLRVIKKYNFGFHWTGANKEKSVIPGRSISFSGYPGVIYSGDDFNTISSGLAVIETTIGNSNPKLWDKVKPHGQILEGIRATVANRLATNGKQWTKLFSRRNSGTYNNQWMVIDYKLFKPGKPLKDNLLWVLEQLPGYTTSVDATQVLRDQTYWPSYNTPYFKDIFEMSGAPANVAKFGDWFSYEKTPRALIFKRDQGSIKDIKSMTKVMRYNNFKNDPLSECDCTPPYSAENAISARCDLNPPNGTYPFGSLGHRSHGGTDMKLTSFGMFQKQEFIAIGGPTFDDLPPFQWSLADFAKDTPHFGMPDLWKFGPVQHSWVFE